MPINLSEIEGAFGMVEGIPHPDWEKVADWISAQKFDDQTAAEAWYEAALQWLHELRTKVPGGYDIYESDHFFLLSADSEKGAMALLFSVEGARKKILETFAPVATDEGFPKSVVISFADVDTYDRYVSRFYPEGEFTGASGLFINEWYGHIVLMPAEPEELLGALVHELCHSTVRHLAWPGWLQEALAVKAERLLSPRSAPAANPEAIREAKIHWQAQGLQSFWSGESFHEPLAQRHSYLLAEILYDLVEEMGREKAAAFLTAASYGDAGEAAAQEHLGLGVGELAGKFLGDGDWGPSEGGAFPEGAPDGAPSESA